MSSQGAYGGPVRVALEISRGLSARNLDCKIISGKFKNDILDFIGLEAEHFQVFPVMKKFPFSSLFGLSMFSVLNRNIKSASVIHIHFARDLIPFTAGIFAILRKKRVVIQTHGMIKFDERILVRIIDKLITLPIANRCDSILALQKYEEFDLIKVGFNPKKISIIENAVHFPELLPNSEIKSSRFIVGFISRLAPVKNVKVFAEIAQICRINKIEAEFLIYGPDEGDLNWLIDYISRQNMGEYLSYGGTLKPDATQKVLEGLDLLVLPSQYDPFPMIVLEALSVGCPVLVSPVCGISGTLLLMNSSYVSDSLDGHDFFAKLVEIINSKSISKQSIQDKAREHFSIDSVLNKLLKVYGL